MPHLTPGFFILLSATGLLVACTAGFYGARQAVRGLRRRSLRARRPVPPEGAERLVWGRVIALQPVRSPVGSMSCVIAWTVVRGLGPDGRTAAVRIATAADFLIESREGLFVVRAEGITVQEGPGGGYDYLTLVPAGPLGEEVLEIRIDLDAPIEYREIRIDEGDEIAVRGVWRREATPTTVALGGYRLAAFLPTLSAAVAYQP
jgi:hypothetical protein